MRCAIYARVSTKRDEQRNSLDNQITFTTNIVKDNAWQLAGTYIDDGVSGTTFLKREAIQQLIHDAKKKKFDVVIAKSVSRFGRSSVESMTVADELEQRYNIRLIFPEDNYDTATSDTKFMFRLKAILAEEESRKLSARIKIGRQTGARLGKYQASLTAFGYKRGDDGKLALDEQYSPIVREMFDLYLYKGWGWYKIASYLNSRNIPTPRTVSGGSNRGTMWLESSIRVILENVVYTGALVQHREETMDFISKKRKTVAPDKQIIVNDAHPAIITHEEHIAALEKMRAKGKHKSNGQESTFAHVARCSDCGKGMMYRKDRLRKEGGAYVCGGYVKHTSAYCSSHIIANNKLLDFVKADLRELITNNVRMEQLYKIAGGELELHQTSYSKELLGVNKQLAKLEGEFRSLLALFQQKVIGIEQFKSTNENIQAEQSRLTARKTELETLIESKKDTERYLQDFQRQVNKIAKLDVDNEQVLKHIIQKLINKIEVHADGSIKIIYNIARPASLGA
ncbi:recombinase family protein [Paenibacillus chartarius]|uniref:Recombinase family protein n=1 Tax=Paenibacillus chartarius TaxID=747481 RepID=A0ABV6DJR4_9BACL